MSQLKNSGQKASLEQNNRPALKDDGKIVPNTEEIKSRRKLKGLSQEDLAAKTGLALKTIRNLETNAAYRCRPITINALSSFYGIEPHLLVRQDNSQNIKLLKTAAEIIEANTNIASSAKKILACLGSRSRDKDYLRQIEDTLAANPGLIHYRAMSLPPFKKVFQDHLLSLISIRDPADRSLGYKTIHIGIFEDTVKQSEVSLCANENSVLIVLPSMYGLNEYNTALLIEDPNVADRFLAIAKSFYQAGRPIETPEAIMELGLVKNGDLYE